MLTLSGGLLIQDPLQHPHQAPQAHKEVLRRRRHLVTTNSAKLFPRSANIRASLCRKVWRAFHVSAFRWPREVLFREGSRVLTNHFSLQQASLGA